MLLAAGLGTVIVGLLVALSLSIYHGVPWVGYRTIYATVPQSGDLLPHDPVRIAGVQVGQVSGISVDRAGDARLALQIDPGTHLPRATTFAIRANGLLGSRYVQLIPGRGGGELPIGTTLRGTLNTLTYGAPDAIAVFNARTRGALGRMVTGLGRGLLGRGQGLNDTISEIAAESVPVQRLVAGMLGAGQLRRLVPALESVMSPLDSARGDIGALLGPAATAVQPLVDQRGAVQQTLDEAPSALGAATAGLGNGERLLDAADALSVQAHDVLPAAPAGLEATSALLQSSHPALVASRRLLAAAKPATPAVTRLIGAIPPVLPRLSQALSRLTPIATKVAPYGCNIENFAAVNRSMTGFGAADQPGGPGGPAVAFRLQVIPFFTTGLPGALGAGAPALFKRVDYSPPCSFMSTPYPSLLNPLAGVNGRTR